MDRVTFLATSAIAVAVLGMSPATAASAPSRIDQWQRIVSEAAERFGIPDTWIRGVMQAESGGRTYLNGRPITSPKGAMGLMQIMPDTYRDLRVQYGLGGNAYDPHDNIFAGAAYLRQMYDRYGYPSLFAAYNAGPKRLENFLFGGRALPRETLDYVSGIVPGASVAFSSNADAPTEAAPIKPSADDFQRAQPLRDTLFFHRKDVNGTANPSSEATPGDALTRETPANFAATNNAALFVPLATSTR
jgi:hypothetical protein